jgi:hypothetical protein
LLSSLHILTQFQSKFHSVVTLLIRCVNVIESISCRYSTLCVTVARPLQTHT